MLRLTSMLIIGDHVFRYVNNVEVNSSWENFTDTATITVPKKMRMKNKDGVVTDVITAGPDALWKRGDPVKIYLGYDDDNDLRFDGVLTRISTTIPLQFTCQDKMFLLKQVTVSKYSRASVSLPQMLKDILPVDPATGRQYAFKAEEIGLGKFIVEKATIVDVLEYLRKPPFGLSSYFQNGVLHVGLAYDLSKVGAQIATNNLAEFRFQKNVIDDSNLDYVNEDDVQLKVRVVNRDEENKITETEFGDPDGELRTIQVYNLTQSDVNTIGQEALQKYKYSGFRGSFTTFLQPFVKHGDIISLRNTRVPDANGAYLVRAVTTRFGMDGGRQEITLDRKI